MGSWYKQWRENRSNIDGYQTDGDRADAFILALRYLRDGPVVVTDVGCGLSVFSDCVKKKNPQAVIHCLDGNPETVDFITKKGYRSHLYRAPGAMPFQDGELDFIHCSHLIEHLISEELYALLTEFDRVLAPGGVLVISAPTLRDSFYNDLSHVRPYNASTLNSYLAAPPSNNSRTRALISGYENEAIFHRYNKISVFGDIGLRCKWGVIDFMLIIIKKILSLMGFYVLERTGYTSVFIKNEKR